MMNLEIRQVEPADNQAVRDLIIGVLTEFGCVGPGYAYNDPEINEMYATYQEPGSRYWVIVDGDTKQLLGGGGYARLKGTTKAEAICELQKLYFLPGLRGQGLGRTLLQRVIEEATADGYGLMYLETVPAMVNAIAMYARFGFEHIPTPLGNTGHTSCPVYMSLPLAPASIPARV